MELTHKENTLLEMLLKVPPDLGAIRAQLESSRFSSDRIAAVASEFIEICYWESLDRHCGEPHQTEYYSTAATVVEGEHSTYLLEIVKLLLEYGLDPNAVVDGTCILEQVRFVENEYIAADTLALLLEHGGNIHLKADGESVFGEIDFDVIFDALNQYDRRRYDSLVHCWFVWLGYGAQPENGTTAVDVYRDFNTGELFDISKLKNHRNYTFGLSHVPGRGESWSLHIFDKETMWEVARL